MRKRDSAAKTTSITLTAECVVQGQISPTGSNATKLATTGSLTLPLLAGSGASTWPSTIEVSDPMGRPLCVQAKRTGTSATVTLTATEDLAACGVASWNGCRVRYAFATTPWKVAKYELWPDETARCGGRHRSAAMSAPGEYPYNAAAWLDFSLPSLASTGSTAGPSPSPSGAKPSGGTPSPNSLELSGTAKVTGSPEFVAIGAIYASSGTQSKGGDGGSSFDMGKVCCVRLLGADTGFAIQSRNVQPGANHFGSGSMPTGSP